MEYAIDGLTTKSQVRSFAKADIEVGRAAKTKGDWRVLDFAATCCDALSEILSTSKRTH